MLGVLARSPINDIAAWRHKNSLSALLSLVLHPGRLNMMNLLPFPTRKRQESARLAICSSPSQLRSGKSGPITTSRPVLPWMLSSSKLSSNFQISARPARNSARTTRRYRVVKIPSRLVIILHFKLFLFNIFRNFPRRSLF